jgi:hypothetical protein
LVKRETVLRIVAAVAPLGQQTAFGCTYSRCAMRLHFFFALSLIMAVASIVGVFVFIPLVSAYAFWIAVAAYVILASSRERWWW